MGSAFQCDRCDSFEEGAPAYDILLPTNDGEEKWYDLCEECKDYLRQFIKGRKLKGQVTPLGASMTLEGTDDSEVVGMAVGNYSTSSPVTFTFGDTWDEKRYHPEDGKPDLPEYMENGVLNY